MASTKPVNSGINSPALQPPTISRGKGVAKADIGDEEGGIERARPGKGERDSNVEISPKAREMADARAKALDIARNSPDVREDKVQEIKNKIAAGTYKTDAGDIADGMLREAVKDKLSTAES